MRIEILNIKLHQLKTKKPKSEYKAYISENNFNKLFGCFVRKNEVELFKSFPIVFEIEICPSKKVGDSEILVIRKKTN